MKALKGVVLIMTVAIAVLMTLMVYGLYQKSENPNFKFFSLGSDTETSPTQPMAVNTPNALIAGPSHANPLPANKPFGDLNLGLPAGAKIVSATVDGNRLIIVVSGLATLTDSVWVVDMNSGKIIGSVHTGR